MAWEIFPWPCIGEFWFISLGLSLHPSYQSLLTRLRSPSTPERFLDLGTCLGQDLRKLVFDGVPVQSVYGSDVFSDFERVSHELFHDADTFKDRFIGASIFDEDTDNALVKTKGTWDVISIVKFLHIFDWATQIRACKIILKLLSRKPGSMVIGAQTGSTEPGEQLVKPPFVAEGEHRSVFQQSAETFTEMWKIVEQDEGVHLRVDVVYDDQEDRERGKKEEEAEGNKKFFSGSKQRMLFFTVEVV